MRKVKLLILTLMLLLVAALPAVADQVDVYENQKLVKSVVFKIGVPYYVVNGKTPGEQMDVAPFIENDRTYVPVRYMGYALGLTEKDVSWDNENQRATLKRGSTVLEMTVGIPEIVTNGQAKTIDVPPVLKSEPAWRTYLPARWVAEGLGYKVDWDEATQTVICWPAGEPKPDVEAVKRYLVEQAGKPEVVRGLEGLFGVTMRLEGSYWYYSPTLTEQKNNQERSYFALNYGKDDTKEYTLAEVSWYRGLPDIRNVELDLSPIEKVLSWKFPDQPDQVQEIMDYAWQVAETRKNKGERLPWKNFDISGLKVAIGSVGFNFVGAIISKEGV